MQPRDAAGRDKALSTTALLAGSMIGLCPEHGGFDGKRCPRCDHPGDPSLEEHRRVRLSKLMSGALRHFPDELGLEPDEKGWVSFETLVDAVHDRYIWATEGAVRAVVGADPKGRFQLREDRIRAAYGHSIEVALGPAETTEDPEVLYHATARETVDRVLFEGLRPMDRNEVHMSPTPEEALEVGQRHDDDPVLLEVDVERLETMGIDVHARSDRVYTAEHVPPDCLEVVEER